MLELADLQPQCVPTNLLLKMWNYKQKNKCDWVEPSTVMHVVGPSALQCTPLGCCRRVFKPKLQSSAEGRETMIKLSM